MRAGAQMRAFALLAMGITLSACAEGGVAGNLRAAGAGQSPDEFMVLPTKPLEMPTDLAALPPPTPGAPNRVDYDPRSDAVASLTGRPQAAGTARAGALIARAGPAASNIRAQLAAEDVVYREENRGQLLPRLFAKDPEDVTYEAVTLDPGAELLRQRARGVGVPAAPPVAIAD